MTDAVTMKRAPRVFQPEAHDADLADADSVLQALQRIERWLERIALAVEAPQKSGATDVPPEDDPRYARLLQAVAGALQMTDLPFDVHEVLEAAEINVELAEALSACCAKDSDRLGLVFRRLRNRRCGGWTLRRDGRNWWLQAE